MHIERGREIWIDISPLALYAFAKDEAFVKAVRMHLYIVDR